ncbi:branched-chain amino acid ABC transporter permease, partial [Chachezhania sediminis]|uniref:branched-chain amino acid ABC transporter permease n=1 Tax=Chachezhania sediminis TaxID=2599291 RepID=UPI0018EF1D6C
MDFIQLLIGGLSNGCIYGLIALGFVLIYKATEAVSFAQGDLMMLGAFLTLGLTNDGYLGWSFWIAVPVAVVLMGAFATGIDRFLVRRLFGEGQIAVVILTIALGFILRFAVGTIWGYEPQVLQSPLNSGEIDIGSAAVG